MKKNRAETMPLACLTHGYAGYEKAGLRPPRETIWAKHVADRLATVGGFMVVNTAGATHSSMPDVMLHTNSGMYYVETKGEDTPVRANQALIACEFNAKSVYSRGELCCFVYRAPDLLGVLRKDKSIFELTRVDALLDPRGFLDSVDSFAQIVRKGTKTAAITELIEELDLVRLPLKRFSVKDNMAAFKFYWINTYTEQLAVKQVLGLTHSSSLALWGYTALNAWVVQEV